MRPFSLIRYFTLASLVTLAVLALAIAWTFSSVLEESLTEEAGIHGEDICAQLNRAIFERFLLPRTKRGEMIDLEDPAQHAALDAVVTESVRDLRILTVNLFTPDGTIIYSTKRGYIGYRSMDNPGIAAALDGEYTSVLKRVVLERDPIRPGHDLLETYGPFYELDPASERKGQIIGVIEIYQDARRFSAAIQIYRQRILAITGGLMLLLFVALFAIVRRGHVRIGELTDALERSNRELEGRVRERTAEIERARRRLQALFDGIADGIAVIDASFVVRDTNRGVDALFGPAPRDGSTSRCFERHAGRDSPCPECPARITLERGVRAEHRYRWPTADGAEREVEVTTFPFTLEEPHDAVIEIVRDVSERAELERQVVQSESLASLGQLAAGVAHEIRNPIGMISSSAQLLAQTSRLEARDRELLEVIQKESARVNETISEFVGFASPPAPSRVATDLRSLLERVRSVLRPEAERCGIELELDVADDTPKILVDPELLYRALANLALNAIQAQPDGGWVGLHAERGEAGRVLLRIDDHGPGIPPEDLERVFRPFFTRRAGGTGLGLSIVQRTVAANGGRLEVRSGPEGSVFTLSFPEAEA
ncbi:MAG: nitrogen regulation protein NR(II) [Myxococcota bacterium]